MTTKPLITDERISTLGWWIIAAFTALGFISGMMAGITLLVWGATQVVDHVQIQKVEVGFNQTAAIDYMYEKVKNDEMYKTMRLLGACKERYPEGGFQLGCGENMTDCQCADGSSVE